MSIEKGNIDLMRLQKYISKSGLCSRRKAEELIRDGKVSVNGILITDMGFKVNPNYDKVKVNNKLINISDEKIYIALNKPEKVITSAKDEKNRKTVLDFTKDIPQ
ncbi:S4 domain-containing protein, partial [Vibrio parahaemolyticus]|nr:S4 domain-containing protein [Vibrio parahaemolyticus]NMR87153.1 rRNA pseudouridine synthase [Vibrio parahaemolyticus]